MICCHLMSPASSCSKATPMRCTIGKTVFDLEARQIADANLDMDPRYGPWLNPPFYACVFVPLAKLPYRQALATFVIFNLLLLGVSFYLLRGILLGGRAGADRSDFSYLASGAFGLDYRRADSHSAGHLDAVHAGIWPPAEYVHHAGDPVRRCDALAPPARVRGGECWRACSRLSRSMQS